MGYEGSENPLTESIMPYWGPWGPSVWSGGYQPLASDPYYAFLCSLLPPPWGPWSLHSFDFLSFLCSFDLGEDGAEHEFNGFIAEETLTALHPYV